jgi:hypothetical protein
MFQLFSHHQVYYLDHAIKLIDTAKHTILTKYMLKILKVEGTMIKWWICKSNKVYNLKVKILQLYRWRYIGTWSCRVYISQRSSKSYGGNIEAILIVLWCLLVSICLVWRNIADVYAYNTVTYPSAEIGMWIWEALCVQLSEFLVKTLCMLFMYLGMCDFFSWLFNDISIQHT